MGSVFSLPPIDAFTSPEVLTDSPSNIAIRDNYEKIRSLRRSMKLDDKVPLLRPIALKAGPGFRAHSAIYHGQPLITEADRKRSKSI